MAKVKNYARHALPSEVLRTQAALPGHLFTPCGRGESEELRAACVAKIKFTPEAVAKKEAGARSIISAYAQSA